jgi:hypothetical protein
MTNDQSFPLSLNFDGKQYDGTITPSGEKGSKGLPIFFRVTLGDQLFAYLCCGDNGWREKDGAAKPNELVSAIGKYIMEHYE